MRVVYKPVSHDAAGVAIAAARAGLDDPDEMVIAHAIQLLMKSPDEVNRQCARIVATCPFWSETHSTQPFGRRRSPPAPARGGGHLVNDGISSGPGREELLGRAPMQRQPARALPCTPGEVRLVHHVVP